MEQPPDIPVAAPVPEAAINRRHGLVLVAAGLVAAMAASTPPCCST